MLHNHHDTDLYWFFQDDPASLTTNSGIITSIVVIMTWGLWKSLVSALLYIDVYVCPSSEALFFFGHLLTRFNLPQAPLVRQAPSTSVSSSIDLSDALETLLELDVYRHLSPLGQLRVVLINNCVGNFDLTSAIRDRSSKVEMQITSCIQRVLLSVTRTSFCNRGECRREKN
jgi:hypothetical protein